MIKSSDLNIVIFMRVKYWKQDFNIAILSLNTLDLQGRISVTTQ